MRRVIQEYGAKIRKVLKAQRKVLDTLGEPVTRGTLEPIKVVKKMGLSADSPEGKRTLDKIYKDIRDVAPFVFSHWRPHPSLYEAQDELQKSVGELNDYARKYNLPVKSFTSPLGRLLTAQDLADWCSLLAAQWGYPSPKERLEQAAKSDSVIHSTMGYFSPKAYNQIKVHITTDLDQQFYEIKKELAQLLGKKKGKIKALFTARNLTWLVPSIMGFIGIVVTIIELVVIKK